MTFIENLRSAVEKTAKSAVKETEKLVSKSKTKYSIFDLNNEIEKIYVQLGEGIYKAYKADESVAELVEQKCAEIDELNKKINELQGKLD